MRLVIPSLDQGLLKNTSTDEVVSAEEPWLKEVHRAVGGGMSRCDEACLVGSKKMFCLYWLLIHTPSFKRPAF